VKVAEDFDFLEGPRQGKARLRGVSRLVQRVEFRMLDLDFGSEGMGLLVEIAVTRNLSRQPPVELFFGGAE
jgi:hypothetical protein